MITINFYIRLYIFFAPFYDLGYRVYCNWSRRQCLVFLTTFHSCRCIGWLVHLCTGWFMESLWKNCNSKSNLLVLCGMPCMFDLIACIFLYCVYYRFWDIYYFLWNLTWQQHKKRKQKINKNSEFFRKIRPFTQNRPKGFL